MTEKISIIMPVYNEEQGVLDAVKSVMSEFKKIGKDFEFIAVNDGSTDKSAEILSKIEGIKLINKKINKGYGAALKTGIKESSGNWIFIIDADKSYPVKSISEFLSFTESYDLISGARIGTYKPFYGRPAKWFLNKLAGYLTSFKIPDLNCGMRLFKKECTLDFINILPDKFSFTSTQMLACLTNNYNVKFIPIDYYKRTGKAKLKKINSFFEFLMLIIRMIIYFNPLKIFTRLSFVLFISSLFVFFYSYFFLAKILDATVITLFLTAVQMLVLGMIAELIVKSRK